MEMDTVPWKVCCLTDLGNEYIVNWELTNGLYTVGKRKKRNVTIFQHLRVNGRRMPLPSQGSTGLYGHTIGIANVWLASQ